MKSPILRIFSLILVLCLLTVPTVYAAEVTEDGHVIQQPERLEAFVFPDDWTAAPLQFCVGNGILNGRKEGLAGGENITRAETAAILVRMLGGECVSPDLSQYLDAEPTAWYYAEVAAAVELGIMKGVSDDRLAPNDPITREQAFTLLCRAFGIQAEDRFCWKQFADGNAAAEYAQNAISALAELHIVTGYPDGTVRPDRYITRAELAKLLYQMFTCICDDTSQLPASGKVLYRGKEPIPEGFSLVGNLTVFSDSQDCLTMTDMEIHGKLTLCVPNGGNVMLNDCNVASLSCAGENMILTLNGRVDRLEINAEGITVNGSGTVGELILNSKGSAVLVSCDQVTDRTEFDPADALKIVETLIVWDTVTKDTALYSSSDLTGYRMDLPAGTKLDHYYYREGNRAASVYTENGKFGWVDINCISIPTTYEIREPYSQEIMEAFVNQKGYTSSTDYLIWVSLKTQTVNVFQGKTGEWKLIRSMPCASGKNSTPTARGEFAIKEKLWEWDFGSYKVKNVTVFYGGYAFHSRIYNRSYTTMLDDAIGHPASDGCLRMLDEDCRYIVDEMPYNTRVVVY